METTISIHALLAESDGAGVGLYLVTEISIHALLAESDAGFRWERRECRIFLSTLSLRRATPRSRDNSMGRHISIHALLAESDASNQPEQQEQHISIHALLAESDRAL